MKSGAVSRMIQAMDISSSDPHDHRGQQAGPPRAVAALARQLARQNRDEDDVVDAEDDLEERQRDEARRPADVETRPWLPSTYHCRGPRKASLAGFLRGLPDLHHLEYDDGPKRDGNPDADRFDRAVPPRRQCAGPSSAGRW